MSAEQLVRSLSKNADIDLDQDISVQDNVFYSDVMASGSLGLGESYMNGSWTAKTSIDVLFAKIGKANLPNIIRKATWRIRLFLILNFLYHYLIIKICQWIPNFGIRKSTEVAKVHYDLGPELYGPMLGETQMYSCAFFKTQEDTLEQAQTNKCLLIREKCGLTDPKEPKRVLDIGCGWGFLANILAESENVKADGITISEEQYKYAQEHFDKDRVSIYLSDYWKWQPTYQYDVIVSVGMFEHVQPNFYREYMENVNRLLKPGGLFLLHTIGGNVSRTVGDAWMTKYIFPNSCLPSMTQIAKASEGKLVIEDVHNLGPHYDRTLMMWYRNFTQAWPTISENNRYDSRFKRMWDYYLLQCAGLFRSRTVQLYQVVFSKNRDEYYSRPAF